MTAAGLSAHIAHYAATLTVIRFTGGCYLLWLSYKSFRAAASVRDLEAQTLSGVTHSPFGFALRGFTIQMTNPKAALAWIAIISLGLQTGAPWWVGFAVVAGTSVLSVIIHCIYAVAFSTHVMVRAYGKARRYIQATLGALFAFAGLKMLTSRT